MVPYFTRHKIELSTNICDLLDVSKAGLQKLEDSMDNNEVVRDFLFDGVHLNLNEEDSDAINDGHNLSDIDDESL